MGKKKKKGSSDSFNSSSGSGDVDSWDTNMDAGPSCYLSTQSSGLDTIKKKKLSLRSLYPPQSWPTSARLSKDSDVYPKQTEDNEPVGHDSDTKAIMREMSRFFLDLMVGKFSEEEEESKSQVAFREQKVVCICTCKPCKCKRQRKKKVEIPPTPIEETIIEEEEEEDIEHGIPLLEELFSFPICDEMAEKLCFNETLLVSLDLREKCDKKTADEKHRSDFCEAGKIVEMGGMGLSIMNVGSFLITYCSTQFSCNSSTGGGQLISLIDHNFITIEEKKTEWHCVDDKKTEKNIHVLAVDDELCGPFPSYIAYRSDTEDGITQEYTGDIEMSGLGDLVMDGGLYILMRYLILIAFKGEFETWSLDLTGELCRCKLFVGKERIAFVKKRPYKTIQIRKELYRDGIRTDVSKTYFLTNGYIVRHKWNGCRYFIHINPMSPILSKKPDDNHCWRKDLVLIRKYLEYKEEKRIKQKIFLYRRPEIRTMLSDYFDSLWAQTELKPEDGVEFSIHYFVNICMNS